MVPRFRSLSAFMRFRNAWVREAQPYLQGPERHDLAQRMRRHLPHRKVDTNVGVLPVDPPRVVLGDFPIPCRLPRVERGPGDELGCECRPAKS